MLEEKIQEKRKELNESIQKNRNYETTYQLSIELDNLIAEFYQKAKEKEEKPKKKVLYIA